MEALIHAPLRQVDPEEWLAGKRKNILSSVRRSERTAAYKMHPEKRNASLTQRRKLYWHDTYRTSRRTKTTTSEGRTDREDVNSSVPQEHDQVVLYW